MDFHSLIFALLCTHCVYGHAVHTSVIKTCNIIDYGAKGDGHTDNTESIQKAIVDCGKASASSQSNGKPQISLVVLPSIYGNKETVYVSGALWLESDLEFRIEANVRLLGTPNKSNASYPYIYTRRTGTMTMTKSSLLNAGKCTHIDYNASEIGDQCDGQWKKLTNVQLSGSGVIDGNGFSGWYEAEYFDIRPCLVQLMWVDGLRITGLNFTDSPFWTIHPLFSNDVVIQNIMVFTSGPNTDGIDPDSCSNVIIEKSFITSGDDCIAIKSGKDEDGRAVGIPSNNITVRDMTFGSGHGIALGSEMSGNVTNVLFENFRLDGTKRGPRIKSQRGRGGVVSSVLYKDISIERVLIGISIDQYYSPSAKGMPPIFSDISIRNLTGSVNQTAGQFLCLSESPCYGIHLENVNLDGYKTGFECQYAFGDAEHTEPVSCLKDSNASHLFIG